MEEIAIKEPEIPEIKEEVKLPEVIETPVAEIPEIIIGTGKEEVKLPEMKDGTQKKKFTRRTSKVEIEGGRKTCTGSSQEKRKT
ncbi:MAG: hypothetical protein MZV64_30275 [Ignavibacteriales bacterium]|nr:hypothetical protein [Ignavibacteriales bacterium]